MGATRQRTPDDGKSDEWDKRIAKLERIVEGIADKLGVADDPEPSAAKTNSDDPGSWEDSLSPEMRAVLRRLGQPHRHKKERHIAPRRRYRVKRAARGQQILALENLTPAGAQIFIYLAQHPKGVSTPEISAALDLKPRTVTNLLTELRKVDLLDE